MAVIVPKEPTNLPSPVATVTPVAITDCRPGAWSDGGKCVYFTMDGRQYGLDLRCATVFAEALGHCLLTLYGSIEAVQAAIMELTQEEIETVDAGPPGLTVTDKPLVAVGSAKVSRLADSPPKLTA